MAKSFSKMDRVKSLIKGLAVLSLFRFSLAYFVCLFVRSFVRYPFSVLFIMFYIDKDSLS